MKQAKDMVRLAQEAEVAGRKSEAAQWLRQAAQAYAESHLPTREAQMLRHASRLETGDEWGFGDSLLAQTTGSEMHNQDSIRSVPPSRAKNAQPPLWLPWQESMAVRMQRENLKCPLIFGPSGSGKHFMAQYFEREVIEIDAAQFVANRHFAISRQTAPVARVTLPDGTKIFDTDTLHRTFPHCTIDQLSKIDAVFVFEKPNGEHMKPVLQRLVETHDLGINNEIIFELCQVAETSSRGMTELISLFSRIPKS